MRIIPSFKVPSFILAAVVLLTSISEAKAITFTPLSNLGGTSFALGINNSEKIVGYSFLPGDTALHAMLWVGNTGTDLGTLGGKIVGPQASMIQDKYRGLELGCQRCAPSCFVGWRPD